MKRLLSLAFLCSVAWGAWAQPNCSQTLRLANSTYEQGRLHELPGLLENCLKSGFTKEERVQAYRLLTLAYIYLEEPEKADASMLALLETDNYFRYNPAVDPAEFIALYKTFRTTPIYRLGVKLGAIATQPNVATSDEATNSVSSYKRGFGFVGGFAAEIPINSMFIFNPELNIQLNSFKYTSTDENNFVLTGSHSLSYISLPLSVQYNFFHDERTRDKNKFSRFNPYVALGVSTDYLLGANLTIDRKRGDNRPVEEKSASIVPQREKLNISAMASAGIKVRIAGGYAVAEVRYKYGVTNVNSKSTTYDNQPLLFDYHYVDGIFKLNCVSLSLGYVHNFFNPKKLSQKK